MGLGAPSQESNDGLSAAGEVQGILLVGSEWFGYSPGGLNRYFNGLLSYLQKAGLPSRGLVFGPADGQPSHLTWVGSVDEPLLSRLRKVRREASALRNESTLVDSHFALYGLPILTTPLRRLPLVVHFQGPWADESAGATSRALNIAAKRALERLVYRRARQCVVLSFSFARILTERYRVVPWSVNVIPPGVDLALFCPSDRTASRNRQGLPPDAWIALAVRRLVPRTGVDDLIRAWAMLPPEADRSRMLVVAGDGPSSASLRSLSIDLGVSDSVRFVGKVTDEHLADLYRAADVSVVPTVELEGFGLVVLESLASGTPVIATRAAGLPEAVGRLGKRLLAEPGDSASLARSLSQALKGEGMPDRESCRKYAENFSWDEIGRRNVEVYRKASRPPRLRPPRIVFVGHSARLSGGELALLRLVTAMKEIDSHVVLAEDGPFAQKLTSAGISVEVLPMGEQGRGLSRQRIRPGGLPAAGVLHSSAYAMRLATWLRKIKPDLVHTNTLKAAVYGGAAARLAGVPCLWHLRDLVSTDYLPASAVQLIKGLARKLPHGIIANSRSTLEQMGNLDCPVEVIGSPVDDCFFRDGSSTREVEIPSPLNAGLTVGMVGRIAPWKGQDIFLTSFAKAFRSANIENRKGLSQSGPRQAKINAVIAGSPLFGEEDYREELNRLTADLRLNERVRFAGFVDDVPSFLGDIDILVHASRTPEPFGLSVVEGMAAGLPVVAAAAGGPAEIIEDGVNGLLYPPGSATALAAGLRKLADDPDLRRRLGSAARVKAQEFTSNRIAAQVLDFYGRLGIGQSVPWGGNR